MSILFRQYRTFMNMRKEYNISFANYVRLVLWRMGIPMTINVSYPQLPGTTFRVNYNILWTLLSKWETPQLNKVKQIVKPNDVILDCGAFIGMYTLLFSNLVGKDGIVFAIEPDHVAQRTLHANIALNKVKNVFEEKYCISNHNGTEILRTNKWGDDIASITRYGNSSRKQAQIQSVCLDDFASGGQRELDGRKVAGVKLDLEGAEMLALIGGRKLFSEHKPWCLLEFEGQYLDIGARANSRKYIEEYFDKFEILSQEPNGKTTYFGEMI